MAGPASTPGTRPDDAANSGPKIYLVPNLMTAGNLCCGFAASLKIVEGTLVTAAAADQGAEAIAHAADLFIYNVHFAIWLILASCIFDLLDGRLARMGGTDSDFGREFDSLADIVSFGVAPALMVYSVVLHPYFPKQLGWIIASVYLVSGALRLARFNCLSMMNLPGAGKEFRGFPIPAAAGLIASLTLFLFWLDKRGREIHVGKWLLPALMLFLAWMMFSNKFYYPSFKGIGWKSKRSLPKFMAILALAGVTVTNLEWMPFVLFLSYLLYGFLRPFLSRKMKHEIEEEDDEDETPVAEAPLD